MLEKNGGTRRKCYKMDMHKFRFEIRTFRYVRFSERLLVKTRMIKNGCFNMKYTKWCLQLQGTNLITKNFLLTYIHFFFFLILPTVTFCPIFNIFLIYFYNKTILKCKGACNTEFADNRICIMQTWQHSKYFIHIWKATLFSMWFDLLLT